MSDCDPCPDLVAAASAALAECPDDCPIDHEHVGYAATGPVEAALPGIGQALKFVSRMLGGVNLSKIDPATLKLLLNSLAAALPEPYRAIVLLALKFLFPTPPAPTPTV